MYRFTHPDTNLTTLLRFDANLPIKFITDGNVQVSKSGRVDTIEVSLPPGDEELKLHYTVLTTAPVSYPPDPSMARSPMFIVGLFPPGTTRNQPTSGVISMLEHGAYLL